MTVEIKMPQLSDTMSSGKILAWRKQVGDKVARGDVLAEVETDKANLEIESFFQGTLLKVLVPAQETAKVGDLIAYIGDPGESVGSSATSNGPTAIVPTETALHSPPQAAAPTLGAPVSPQTAPSPASKPPASAEIQNNGDRIKISPLARKLAESAQVDIASIAGSGPSGRIVRADIERAATGSGTSTTTAPRYTTAPTDSPPQKAATPSSPSVATPQPLPPGAAPSVAGSPSSGSLTPLSKMRETIARRMQESVTQAPHFYSTTAVDMGAVARLREELKARPEFSGISVNHFVIKAAAYALSREQRVNGAYRDGQVYQPPSINIGVITAIDDGLLIPVIRDADKLAFRDLVFEAKAAIERARAGRPNSTDLTGGTFSISNMGMFDVESFTAIINPGQGAVLAVSATKEVPVVKDSQIVVGKQMRVTLSVDHRIIDGVMAARFLGFFKQALEQPALMFV